MFLTYFNQICLGVLKDYAESFDCTIDTVIHSIRNQTRVQWKRNGLDVFPQKRAIKLTVGAMTINHYINMQSPFFQYAHKWNISKTIKLSVGMHNSG